MVHSTKSSADLNGLDDDAHVAKYPSQPPERSARGCGRSAAGDWLIGLLSLATLLAAARPLAAQFRVTPDGSPVTVPLNSTEKTVTFTLYTGVMQQQTWHITPTCSAPLTSCWSPAGYDITFTQAKSVDIKYQTPAAGSGTVTLHAERLGVSDNGSYNVTVDGTPPDVRLLAPTGDVDVQFPTIQIAWCDDNALNAGSRWIKVNGVDKTTSFDYVGSGPPDCVVKASSTSNSVGLNVGSNTIAANICDNAGNCTTNSFTVTRVTYGVAVTPDGSSTPQRPANSTGYSTDFSVQNTGSAQNTYSLSCGGSTNVTCTGLTVDGQSASNVTLTGGALKTVTASYNVGAVGNGTLSLTATGTNASDAGSYTVPVVTPSAQPSIVDVSSVNPGTFVERGLCLTMAAGAAAASECGDLRVVHRLPTTRTMNTPRTPTLLYNSQTAHPYPVIAANVTLPSGAAVPDSVTATLWIGPPQATAKWLGTQWAPGQMRRVALGFDALSYATGVYAYTLEIRNWYPDPTPSQPTTVTGELIVVNRSNSPFGAGWWLAGLEQLFWIADGRKLVVLGDGSARVYSPVGGNLYTAANPTRPDTLDGTGTDYVRRAPHGVRVHFDASTGNHVSTVNRLGHQTTFGYDLCTQARLSTITVPPAGSGNYTLSYASPTDCATKLASVTAPGNRVTYLTDPSGRVTAITDPDGHSVAFAYDANVVNRLASRTDRRGNPTFYGFDASGKVTMDSLPLDPSLTPIVQRFRPAESVALAGPADTAAVYTRVDGPRLDTDVRDTTAFWLDRFGAPRRIVNALGYETVLKREDSRWPALVTELQAPNQFVTRATYTARGNDSTTTAVNPFGDGRDAVTRYHWDAKWDYVDSIITPMNVVTTMGYDVNNGNRLWQQVGGDAARRVSFRYGNSFGLLSSTVVPQTPPDSVEYDSFANVQATRTPRLFWTSFYKDALGRDTLVVTPIDSTDKSRGLAADSTARVRQRTVFTVMDQDSIVETIAPNRTEAVRVDKRYDFAGNLLSLARVSVPDLTSPAIGTITTQWRYDRGNRRVAEVAPDGMVDSTEFDPAGNVTKAVTRRKDPTSGSRLTINMSYDALNRLITKALPQITYQARPTQFVIEPPGSVWEAEPYPAYQIPAETHTFTYDAMGQLLTAENADAKVKRVYYPGGLIRLDSLRIQTVARDDWERHKFGLEYTYDLDGRRTLLAVPHQLGIGNDTTISYAYYVQTGQLQTLTALQSRDYTFGYSMRGDLTSIYYPWYSAYSEGLGYDSDGQLAADTIFNNASATYPRIQSAPLVRATKFFYDAQHKLQLSGETIQLRDTLRPSYSGLGNLTGTTWSEWGCTGCELTPTDRHVTTETLTPDALGNLAQSNVTDELRGISYDPGGDQWHYQSSTTCCDTWGYQPGTGRMTTMSVAQQYPRSFFYDSAGNQEFSSAMDPQNGKTATERAAFFAADGSLRMVDARSAQVPNVYMGEWQTYVVEDYRYDALGRRVWVRARKWCDDYGKDVPAATECRVGVLRRTIWDGNEEVAEIQMPWALQGVSITARYDTTQQQQWWENDVNPVSLPLVNVWGSKFGDPNPFFGHVIYGGARGTDQPLAITRVNYVMGMDWRYGNSGSQYIYNPPRVQSPFTIVPFWNASGDAPVGVFGTGVQALCNPSDQYTGCVAIRWPWNWSSSDRNGGLPHDYWHGTLLDGKRDGSGFRYMRNRYYDPLTGRFTQEDPIGLAGGLNAYGFAAGDPINYDDPFGLHPCGEAGNQDHDDEVETGRYDPNGKEITKKVHVDCSKERMAAEHERRRRLAFQEAEEPSCTRRGIDFLENDFAGTSWIWAPDRLVDKASEGVLSDLDLPEVVGAGGRALVNNFVGYGVNAIKPLVNVAGGASAVHLAAKYSLKAGVWLSCHTTGGTSY